MPRPHKVQAEFINSPAKRRAVRAGRRGGKTVGVAIMAVQRFLAGRRVLYAAPTDDQIDRFWSTVKRCLEEPIDAGVYGKNETKHIIELPGTEQRIRAKTAWNADSLRGDYADELILDEYQLMNEDAWETVGAPMMLDTNGNATFVYTPPSLRTAGVSKARDPRHASKLFERARKDTSGRWGAFHFSSHDNPHLSKIALDEITGDMTNLAYRQEILAEDIDEVPGALWTRATLERCRVDKAPELKRIVIAVDPKASAEADSEAGIIAAGLGIDGHGYLLGDYSMNGSPEQWAQKVATAYELHHADRVIAEKNNGGDMVMSVLKAANVKLSVKLVTASRGKATRAEPVAAMYEQFRVHHIGSLPWLEDQYCTWLPGDKSPDRLDAAVWAITDLMLGTPAMTAGQVNFYGN